MTKAAMMYCFFLSVCVATLSATAQAQQPPDPDYCVNNYCGIGDGDCDPGQCDEGVCVNDIGARHGLPAHYDVCEARGSGQPDPDYCVGRACGAGEGDCDPGQCAAGLTCVNDVGARYGLPAHYDVCEAAGTTCPQTHAFDGIWDFRLTLYDDFPCRRRPPETFWIELTRSSLIFTESNTLATFVVSETGQLEGHISEASHLLSFSGFLSDRTGGGVWFNAATCAGEWTARKR